jgi:hypothetical protein
MFDSIVTVCGRQFSPELLTHLSQFANQEPAPSGNQIAKEACSALAWFSPNGRPALSSAKVALRKLQRRGLLELPRSKGRPCCRHRLRRSGQGLPPLKGVPRRADKLRGLQLHLLSGAEDPLHTTWNDLIIEQHPLGDAPLVGAQLRYLIGSEHGWLGALGFGPAAFVLGCRDQWIGWSTPARLAHLPEVVGLSRLLLRAEVSCRNLASKVLGLVASRLADDWQARYAVRPKLLETYVERSRFNGLSLSASNWLRLGTSSGRGRLGPKRPSKTLKDVWVYPLDAQARQRLQVEVPPPLSPCPLIQSLSQTDWCGRELSSLDLGDQRRNQRAVDILEARWNQPQASFYGSFDGWTPAKGAYGLIEHRSPEISLQSLLASHQEQTQGRMAAEPWVLLPQDTTTLNYSGLHQTTGLGPLGEKKGQGLWLHSLLAFRPDGVPLGVLEVQCWARDPEPNQSQGRNAKSLDEKESARWVEAFQKAASAARRMPQSQLVVITDREGDLYELHDAVQPSPANLHLLVRAQHDRQLECHQKLWDFMGAQPLGQQRNLAVPRGHGQPARTAVVEVRWAQVSIEAPAVGHKKGWPALSLWAVWVHESSPPDGVEPIDWMLLTDLPVNGAEAAWEKVQWYCERWGIEEWHRALKTGCGAEQREFKTAEHLQRVLAFDLIVAWRVLACVKLGRELPQLPATVLYAPEELRVLVAAIKKTPQFQGTNSVIPARGQSPGGAFGRLCRKEKGRGAGSGERWHRTPTAT